MRPKFAMRHIVARPMITPRAIRILLLSGKAPIPLSLGFSWPSRKTLFRLAFTGDTGSESICERGGSIILVSTRGLQPRSLGGPVVSQTWVCVERVRRANKE